MKQVILIKKIVQRTLVFSLVYTLLSCVNTPTTDSSQSEKESHINVEHRLNKTEVTSSDNYTRLGAGYLARNNYEKALTKLEKAIRLNARNANAYNYMGVLYWRIDKPQLAEKYFRISQNLSPFNAAINHNYASFLCAQKKYEQASVLFEKVFSNPLYDQLSNAYQVSGECDLEISAYDLAQSKFKRSLKINPKNSKTLLGMAKLFYKLKKIKTSEYYFTRFEKLSKHTPDSLWLGINIQRKLDDRNKLSSYILELKNLYPDSKETLFYIEGKQGF